MSTNVALTGTPSADSQYGSSYAASNANDGSTSTRWISASGAPHWWQVDLAASYTVSSVEFIASLISYGEHFSEYYIETWNGASWVEQVHVTNYTEESPAVTTHTISVSTQKVRIRTLGGNSYHGLYEFRVWADTAQTKLEDAAVDLAAYYRGQSDLKSFLRAHDGIEFRDLQGKLEAAGWNMADFAGFLSACYQSLSDAGMDLATWGTHYDDFKSLLAAWFQHMEDVHADLAAWHEGYLNWRTFLEAAAFAFKDLRTWMASYGQHLASLPSLLWAGKAAFKSVDLCLSATNGIVLDNLGLILAATDGVIQRDMGFALHAIGSVPVFCSITAQRIYSVVSEAV